MYNINIKKEKYCMYNEKIGKKIFNTPRGISNAIVIKNINNLTYNLLFFDTLLYFIKSPLIKLYLYNIFCTIYILYSKKI